MSAANILDDILQTRDSITQTPKPFLNVPTCFSNFANTKLNKIRKRVSELEQVGVGYAI